MPIKNNTKNMIILIVIATAEPQPPVAWGRLAVLRPDLDIKPAAIPTGEWGARRIIYEVVP